MTLMTGEAFQNFFCVTKYLSRPAKSFDVFKNTNAKLNNITVGVSNISTYITNYIRRHRVLRPIDYSCK